MDIEYVIETILKNDIGASLISIIFTAILTYSITKKSEYKRKSLSIMDIQLHKIYLPLYVLLDKDINFINVEKLVENMETKRKKYLLYLPNTFLYYTEQMRNELSDNQISQTTIKKCRQFVRFEYMRLRKNLGYPYKVEFSNKYFIFYLLKLFYGLINVNAL